MLSFRCSDPARNKLLKIYLGNRVISQCQFLQVLDAIPGNKLKSARVSALSADWLVIAPIGAMLLDTDATSLVDLSLQCNVGSDLIYDADFGGHLRHATGYM